MLRQYFTQRSRSHTFANGKTVRVGTIPLGTIAYLQDGMRPLGGMRGAPILKNPWIVEAWNHHLATVRSLRDGRRKQVADWLLLQCSDCFLTRD
jgi:hypothetical protein